MTTHPATGRLVAVCAGRVTTIGAGRRELDSGIDKRPLDGTVALGADGIATDEVGEPDHHGGVDQALYAYAEEDAAHWEAELGRDLPPGTFGENLRLRGVDVTASRVGDRWRLGDGVEVVVTGPRIPCATFATFWDVPDLVPRFLAAGRPGAYLRVVAPGTVRAGDAVEVVHRAADDVTVADVSRIRSRDRDEADRLVDLPDLAHRIRDWAASRAGSRA